MKDFLPKIALPERLRAASRSDFRAVVAAGMLLLAAGRLNSQTPAKTGTAAEGEAAGASASRTGAGQTGAGQISVIKSFRIVQEKDGQAVEILSTRPLVPAIQAIGSPDRLVIDLLNARLDTQQKRIRIEADQISALRADQYQENPPIARVVVDLLAPRSYKWDAAGNRLIVHLGKSSGQASDSPFQPPEVASLTPGPQAVVTAVRAAGPMTVAGSEGGTGSTIAAGEETAIVSLSSGGEVHVCPGTTLSVTPSQNRHNLMLSLNTGALETHLALDASSDSVLTPDFRILLVGPGEFHYAISADKQGNTCVRSLPGNTAAAMVMELLGDRTYQVKATDQLVFRAGQLDRVDTSVPLECGCPPARKASTLAANSLPAESGAQANASLIAANPTSASGAAAHAEIAAATGVPGTAAAPEAPTAPEQTHVQVEVPFVFHATGPPPLPAEDVRALPVVARPLPAELATVAPLPPVPPSANQKPAAESGRSGSANHSAVGGFFRKIGGFFAAIFH